MGTPPDRTVVRPAGERDLELLVGFNRALARETEGLDLDPDRLRAGVRAVLGDAARGSYLVAEAAGRAVGALLVTREWSDWRAGWFWWIQSVYVEPEHRRRGVYGELHREVAARARRAGDVRGLRLYVDRANAGARATYLALGMAPSHYDLFETEG